jgi:hypothetical protein
MAGFWAFWVTQSTPSITPEVEPEPLQPSTLTAVSGASGVTPTTSWMLSIAATVPATCVPWPFGRRGGALHIILEDDDIAIRDVLRRGLRLRQHPACVKQE